MQVLIWNVKNQKFIVGNGQTKFEKHSHRTSRGLLVMFQTYHVLSNFVSDYKDLFTHLMPDDEKDLILSDGESVE